jgi:hypothetical protein
MLLQQARQETATVEHFGGKLQHRMAYNWQVCVSAFTSVQPVHPFTASTGPAGWATNSNNQIVENRVAAAFMRRLANASAGNNVG